MKTTAPQIDLRPVDSLIPYVRNSRTHSDDQIAQIAASLDEFGMVGAIVVRDGVIGKGHGTLAGIRKLYSAGKRLYPPPGKAQGAEPFPEGTVPVLDASGWTDAQFRAFIIADNKLALNAGWDDELLSLELGELRDDGFDLDLIGFSGDELADLLPPEGSGDGSGEGGTGSLADRFMVAPFSVLNAREGWWQDRKNAWIALGIRSELGRGANGSPGGSPRPAADYSGKERGNGAGKRLATTFGTEGNASGQSGTSIFDPVLCELAYRWFSPARGVILDPFAGGSVRGLVAAKLGRQYVGSDLRKEQVEANRAQAEILGEGDPVPVWHCGDSRNIDKTCKGLQADFLFSCPPYADLEVYSDDPADLSTLAYEDFRAAYFDIIKRACGLLKQDRFAAFVVGEVRDKRGAYYDFVGDTVQAFREAGLDYYNEAILVTMVGSLPIRAGKQFSTSRKLGKTHQNLLVFCKGDPRKAVEACGDVEIGDDLFPEAGDQG